MKRELARQVNEILNSKSPLPIKKALGRIKSPSPVEKVLEDIKKLKSLEGIIALAITDKGVVLFTTEPYSRVVYEFEITKQPLIERLLADEGRRQRKKG